MNTIPRSVAAFTLIEMMIAVALGSLIVYTALAGVRVASQTVSLANKLSLENGLLRAGYFEAQTQLDFWTNFDNPEKDDSERPLKQVVGGKGLPFTPMRDLNSAMGLWPKAGTVPRNPGTGNPGLNMTLPRALADIGSDAMVTDAWENDRGWDPTVSWAPHDPRTWCRANLAEKLNVRRSSPANLYPPMLFGRYAIFASTDPGSALFDYDIEADPNNPGNMVHVSYSGYPIAGVHTWYYKQLEAMLSVMGYAALCEYLPPNSIYTYYTTTDNTQAATSFGGIARITIDPGGVFCNGDGGQKTSRGIYRQTYSTSYGYINPRASDTQNPQPGDPLPSVSKLKDWHYQHYNTDYGAYNGGGQTQLQWFINHTVFMEKLLESKPEHWPVVEVAVGRFIKNAHHVAIAKIRKLDTLSGDFIELSWTGLGSTLRGARQQRLPTGKGWAKWDNKVGATCDNNLDTP
jgi:prepilin-type N-terminal cleavage/methylation domain-containing protein